MSARRAWAALLLVSAVLAVIVAPSLVETNADRGSDVAATATKATAEALRIDGIVPRIAGDVSWERVERTARPALALFAVAVALLWAGYSDRRNAARRRTARHRSGSSPSPILGRAPPSAGLSIV